MSAEFQDWPVVNTHYILLLGLLRVVRMRKKDDHQPKYFRPRVVYAVPPALNYSHYTSGGRCYNYAAL